MEGTSSLAPAEGLAQGGEPKPVASMPAAPKPATPMPAASKPGIRSLKSTVKIPTSLHGARELAVQQAQAETAKATQPENPQPLAANLPDRAYSREEFTRAWNEYAEQVKAAGRQGEYIVLKEAPDLADDHDHLVKVRISNSVQKDFFEKAKPAAQAYLRKALQNSRISLEYIIVKEEEGKRLYTGQEKFGYLLKKYPHLQDLKERLGLEADF